MDFLPLLSVMVSDIASSEDVYIAPDAPGCGGTPPSLCTDPTVPAMAALINGLRHEICAELTETTIPIETILVGHSMGCRIALETFLQFPANVTGLVLLDGSWYGPTPKDYKPLSRNKEEELRIVLDVFGTMLGPSTPADFKHRVLDNIRSSDLDYLNRIRINYITWDGEEMEKSMAAIRYKNENSSSRTRVLVVQGTEGHGAARHSLKKGDGGHWVNFVHDRLGQDFTGLIVEDSGHWPHVDKVDEVVTALKVFADELASR